MQNSIHFAISRLVKKLPESTQNFAASTEYSDWILYQCKMIYSINKLFIFQFFAIF